MRMKVRKVEIIINLSHPKVQSCLEKIVASLKKHRIDYVTNHVEHRTTQKPDFINSLNIRHDSEINLQDLLQHYQS